MKKTISVFIFILIAIIAFPQMNLNPKQDLNSRLKPFVGLQINPFLDRNTFTNDYTQIISAVRFGINFKKFDFGIELFDFYSNSYIANSNCFALGLFSSFSFMKIRSTKLFVEIMGYYSTQKTIFEDVYIPHGGQKQMIINKFNYCFSPGISIDLYKKKWSLDLMIKMSTNRLIIGKYIVPTFKIKYHF